jgi:hypothetical protein
MAATAEQQQLAETLPGQIQESSFPGAAQAGTGWSS